MSFSLVEQWAPLINMVQIIVSGIFLVVGYILIRRKNVVWHHRSMLIATAFAALFLVTYVARYLLFGSKLFAGEGAARGLYLMVLTSHVLLAVAVGPLAIITIRRALRGDWGRHRYLARRTLPIWLYVVVTGYAVYVWLYWV